MFYIFNCLYFVHKNKTYSEKHCSFYKSYLLSVKAENWNFIINTLIYLV